VSEAARDRTFGPEWSAVHRRGSSRELRRWLDLALRCCDEADGIARRHFGGHLEIERKSDGTLVTQADQAIERVLRERILAAYPGHGLVGEEYGQEAAGASVRWYLDPIDGTHNYVRGVPIFATLIAVERDGEVQVGVASAPALGQRWFAWRGGGAWSVQIAPHGVARPAREPTPGSRPRPRRLHASVIADLTRASIVYGSLGEIIRAGFREPLTALIDRAWRDRGFGEFWGHALVAEGKAEAMIEIGLKPWDIAALLVLVEEAGGRLTDAGGDRGVHLPEVVTSNGHLHRRLLEILARR
jgi:histidinol-phosphatase